MKHTHKYELVKNGRNGNRVYRCIQPDCNHFLAPEFMHGRKTACKFCDSEFIITKASLGSSDRRKKFLQCGCRNKPKVIPKINALDDLLKGIKQ